MSPAVLALLALVAAIVLSMTTRVNVGLLSLAISLAEGDSQLAVWRERFRWLTPYYLAAGPLALALAVAFETVGHRKKGAPYPERLNASLTKSWYGRRKAWPWRSRASRRTRPVFPEPSRPVTTIQGAGAACPAFGGTLDLQM